MNDVGVAFDDKGKYEEAELMHRQTLARREKVLGAEHPSTLTSMANLASTYRNQGRWKEAEELEVQVMETSLRVLGAEHLWQCPRAVPSYPLKPMRASCHPERRRPS